MGSKLNRMQQAQKKNPSSNTPLVAIPSWPPQQKTCTQAPSGVWEKYFPLNSLHSASGKLPFFSLINFSSALYYLNAWNRLGIQRLTLKKNSFWPYNGCPSVFSQSWNIWWSFLWYGVQVKENQFTSEFRQVHHSVILCCLPFWWHIPCCHGNWCRVEKQLTAVITDKQVIQEQTTCASLIKSSWCLVEQWINLS